MGVWCDFCLKKKEEERGVREGFDQGVGEVGGLGGRVKSLMEQLE